MQTEEKFFPRITSPEGAEGPDSWLLKSRITKWTSSGMRSLTLRLWQGVIVKKRPQTCSGKIWLHFLVLNLVLVWDARVASVLGWCWLFPDPNDEGGKQGRSTGQPPLQRVFVKSIVHQIEHNDSEFWISCFIKLLCIDNWSWLCPCLPKKRFSSPWLWGTFVLDLISSGQCEIDWEYISSS